MKYLAIMLGVAIAATSVVGEVAIAAEQPDKGIGTHPESPLRLDEIWRSSSYSFLRISPDGKHFVGTGKIEGNKNIVHVIERDSMRVIRSENFQGEFDIGAVGWFDNQTIVISATYKTELHENTMGAGSYLLDIKTGVMKPLFRGMSDQHGDAGNGGSIAGKIDKNNYWMSVYPTGMSQAIAPYVYLYRLNIDTGLASKVLKSPSRESTFIFNQKSELTHAVGSLPDSYDDAVVHRRVGNKWELESQFRLGDGGCMPMRWHKEDPDKLLYICNDDASTRGAFWVNTKTGKRELIYRHPKVDFDRIEFDADDEAIWVEYQYDYPVTESLMPNHRRDVFRRKVAATFPDQYTRTISATEDGLEEVIHVSDERGYGKYYIYNHLDGKIRFLLDPRPDQRTEAYPRMHAVHIKARDGLEMVGYLTVPKQAKVMKDLPLIIHPHGGPYGPRDYWGYNPEVVAFANAGYAVLQVNYRGSGGYGRNFEYDWYGHWGLEMQEDLEDATHWAINQGIADPNRICIYGASYGGYAALQGVVKTPDLYQCSIGYVGVYNLNTFWTHGDVGRRKAGKKYLAEAIGTDREDMARRSSTPNVDKIKAPVFLVHGMRDYRVHPKHYLDMREALEDKGHRFETLEIQRAAHGARELASITEISCRMIDFFDRHIGPGKPMDPPASCEFEGKKDHKYEYFKGN